MFRVFINCIYLSNSTAIKYIIVYDVNIMQKGIGIKPGVLR